jgi:hypothetical protein
MRLASIDERKTSAIGIVPVAVRLSCESWIWDSLEKKMIRVPSKKDDEWCVIIRHDVFHYLFRVFSYYPCFFSVLPWPGQPLSWIFNLSDRPHRIIFVQTVFIKRVDTDPACSARHILTSQYFRHCINQYVQQTVPVTSSNTAHSTDNVTRGWIQEAQGRRWDSLGWM